MERYETAQVALETFIREPDVKEIMVNLQQLVEDRNAALDAAQRAVKQQLLQSEQDKLVVHGFGAQKKISRWYDGDYLARELPATQADLVLEEQVVYKVKVDELQQLLRQGEIDANIIRLAYHEEAPVASLMPGAPKPYALPAVPLEEEDSWQQPQDTEAAPPPPREEEKRSSTRTSKARRR